MADETYVPMLDGREVDLRVVGIGVGLTANEYREKTGDRLRASFLVLAESAHWKDSGERIFADLKAIEAWPMPNLSEVIDLAYAAAELNRSKRLPPVTTNGTGEPLPSPSP
jgi:hypothetical protein